MVLRLYGCNKRAKWSDYKGTYATAADTFEDTCSSGRFRRFEFQVSFFIFCIRLLNSQAIIGINLAFHVKVKVYQKV